MYFSLFRTTTDLEMLFDILFCANCNHFSFTFTYIKERFMFYFENDKASYSLELDPPSLALNLYYFARESKKISFG